MKKKLLALSNAFPEKIRLCLLLKQDFFFAQRGLWRGRVPVFPSSDKWTTVELGYNKLSVFVRYNHEFIITEKDYVVK